MAVWFVRIDSNSNKTMVVHFSGAASEEPIRIEFDRHLRKVPGIRRGDDVVFAREASGDLYFLGHARVKEVKEEGDATQERPARTPPTILVFDGFVAFPEERALSVFALSLTVVRMAGNPRRHFARSVRRLGKHDLQTLVEGHIYVARTAFYLLHAALPPRLQREFDRFASGRQVSLSNARVTDLVRFDLLKEYVQTELYPKLGLLIEARSAYARIRCESKPPYETLISEGIFEESGTRWRRHLGPATDGAALAFEEHGTLEVVSEAARTSAELGHMELRWNPLS